VGAPRRYRKDLDICAGQAAVQFERLRVDNHKIRRESIGT
jgi:hypothetical protein